MKIGSFSLIKEINTSIILNTIRTHKTISRAQIANITGLTPATVTNLTSKLLDCKLISETKLGASSGGRKPVMLEINSSEYNVACISIVKHKTAVSLYDLAGNCIISQTVDVSGLNSESVLIKLSAKVNELVNNSDKRVLGVGISCEGMINEKDGICVYSSNLSWEHVPVKDIVERETALPSFVDNDVKVSALGEKWFGQAKDVKNFVLFSTGYGIGVSVMNDGELLRGAENYATEFGHTVIDPINGPLCSCGNRGCLRTFASGSALLNSLNHRYKTETSIFDIIKDSEKDTEIYEILKRHAYYIGIGAANAINIFNPAELIFNGYVTSFGDEMKKIILDTIDSYCLKSMKPCLKIVFSNFDAETVNKGTAALSVSHLYNSPSLFFGADYDL